MTPERWAQVGRIFGAAQELAPADRPGFLDVECSGDSALREEVESLLSSLDRAETFLEEPIAATLEEEPAPRRVGPWEVIEEIGRGGMGVVFRARRTDQGFDRFAAVKLVKRGMDTDFVLRRFESERRILAALDHPHIARVLDGGSTDDGLPYFVMELIEGEGLFAYAQRRGLGLAGRIALFRQICSAVEYAHQRLVIHRDIKPSNVLVTADGTVKLLDFGLAKVLGGEDAGERTRTIFRLFTPEYASPEQVRGETLTTASDVYSLGVVLHELLTGSPPYRLESGGSDELRGAILDQDPPRTRTKARLPRDVDAIVRTALRKEPARRYPSVEGLSDDLRRWLEGLPVRARPDRLSYRALKFVKRHRAGLSAAALAVLSLVAALALSVRQMRLARRERDRARIEAAKDLQVSSFLRSLFESSYPMRSKGRALTAQDLLDAGAGRVDRDLAGQPEVRASMLALLGSVYGELGLYAKSQPLLERSLAIREALLGADHPDVAESLNFLGRLRTRQARDEEARALLERAVRIRERSAPSAALAETLSNLGGAFKGLGRFPEARAAYERAISVEKAAGGANLHKWLTNLASIDIDEGDFDAARRKLERALEIGLRREGRADVQVDVTLLNLAELYREREDYGRALSLLRQAFAIDENAYGKDGVGYTAQELGSVYLEMGDRARALEYIRRAREIGERQNGPEHPATAAPLDLEGRLLVAEGRAAEAVPLFERALGCWRKTFPGDDRPEVAGILVDLADARLSLDGPAGAEPLLRAALAIQRRTLPPAHPGLVPTLTALGQALVREGRAGDARPFLEEAVGVARARFPERHSQRLAAEAALRLASSVAPATVARTAAARRR